MARYTVIGCGKDIEGRTEMNPRKMRNYGMHGFTKNVNRNTAKQNKELEEKIEALEDMVDALGYTVDVLCGEIQELKDIVEGK